MKTCILHLLICCLTLGGYAQSSSSINYDVKGLIADSVTHKPLDFVTVGLKTDKNTPLRSALTKSDGS
ncbi:MAG TPA: hypothetical protein VGD31_16555, partial [Sphingobacteriaceae bacterium]